MKSLMKSMTAVFMFVVLCLTMAVPAFADGHDCDTVKGAAIGQDTSPTTGVVNFTVTIGHDLYTGTGYQTLTGATPQPDGSLAFTATHTLIFRSNGKDVGTISTTDTGTIVFTKLPGIANITETMVIAGGTGRFSGASGAINVKAVEDFSTGKSVAALSGQICK